jgi:hydrogenase expression/formation protein HypE
VERIMAEEALPLGKLPLSLLRGFLKELPVNDPNVLVGPGIGEDAAVIRFGDQTLVFKTDPITFAVDDIAWYLVTINANDIACMGGIPKYMLVTMLLPQGATTPDTVHTIFSGLKKACAANDITLVGGHTEITHGIARPIAIGFMIGTLSGYGLVRASGARPGNIILLSKSIPLEATSLLAREVPERTGLDDNTLFRASRLIYEPGISVTNDARIALAQGGVTAMHDPTEGGLATGLLEIATASGCGIEVYMESIPILDLAHKILPKFSIDPLGALASGSLLVCCEEKSAPKIIKAWEDASIKGTAIGRMTNSKDLILYREDKPYPLPSFAADEITKVFS